MLEETATSRMENRLERGRLAQPGQASPGKKPKPRTATEAAARRLLRMGVPSGEEPTRSGLAPTL